MLGGQSHGGLQGRIGVGHAVVRLVGRLEALQHAEGILHRRLVHLHHLEAAGEGPVPIERSLQILEGGGADAAQFAGGEGRLEQIRCIHGPAAGGSGSDQCVHLIHEEDGPGQVRQRLEHGLEPLLEVAAIAASRKQRAQVQGEDPRGLERLRNIPFMDAPGQALHDGGLAHAGLAHQQGVVLATAAEHLGHAGDLGLAAHQGIEPTRGGPSHQVRGIGFQGVLGHRAGLLLFGLDLLLRLGLGHTGTVAEHFQQGQPLDAVLFEELARVAGFLFQKSRQQLAALHAPLAGAEGVDQGPLHHAHESQRAVGLEGLALGHHLESLSQHGLQVGPQGVQLHAAALQDPGRVGIVHQGQQQVLQGHVLMAAALGQVEGPLETLVQLGTDLRHRRPPRRGAGGSPRARPAGGPVRPGFPPHPAYRCPPHPRPPDVPPA